jgi:hypothetical protein
MSGEIDVLERGDSKQAPFTICIIANPVLENSLGQLVPDPILGDPARYKQRARFVADALLGRIPGQEEATLADPDIAPHVRIVSLFSADLNSIDPANALVQEDQWLIPRWSAFRPFMNRFDLDADVGIAISRSDKKHLASSFFTRDDDTRAGIPFELDGRRHHHRFWFETPGTTALHIDSRPTTIVHEFAHALSSYTNGKIVDLYVDGALGVNNKQGRPIPDVFGSMNGVQFLPDQVRDSLGYGVFQSYHCEQIDPSVPALMDDFSAAAEPGQCVHDKITRAFLRDRLLAKLKR